MTMPDHEDIETDAGRDPERMSADERRAELARAGVVRTVTIHVPGTNMFLADGAWTHNDMPSFDTFGSPSSGSGSGSGSSSGSSSGSGSGGGKSSGSSFNSDSGGTPSASVWSQSSQSYNSGGGGGGGSLSGGGGIDSGGGGGWGQRGNGHA